MHHCFGTTFKFSLNLRKVLLYEGKRFKLVLVSSFVSFLLYSYSHSNNNIKISFFLTKSLLNSAGWKTQRRKKGRPQASLTISTQQQIKTKKQMLPCFTCSHALKQVHTVHTIITTTKFILLFDTLGAGYCTHIQSLL